MNNRTSLGDLSYTLDANKNKTSESIAIPPDAAVLRLEQLVLED
jgi:hypothetical protein